MSKKGKQEIKDLIEYCMKYYNCKLCPRNEQCKKEEQKDKVKILKRKK